MNKLLILVLCPFLLFCSKSNPEFTSVIPNFPEHKTLEGTQILKETMGTIYITKIDSLFVLSTIQDTLIHIYDTDENFISSFGKIGRGPNEFSNVPFINFASSKDNFNSIYSLDRQLLKVNVINLNSSIVENKLIMDNEIELPSELVGTQTVFFVDDEKIIGIYDDKFYRALDQRRGGFYYFPYSETFEIIELHNLQIDPYEVMPATNINSRIAVSSPDGSKFAIVLTYSPLLEIFDTGSTTPKRYYLGSTTPQNIFELESFKDEELIEYYTFIDSSDKYIYLLFSGNHYSETPLENKIQVIDWDGNPIKEYIIPQNYGLNMFKVDEENSTIYGLSYSNDAIYKFNF